MEAPANETNELPSEPDSARNEDALCVENPVCKSTEEDSQDPCDPPIPPKPKLVRSETLYGAEADPAPCSLCAPDQEEEKLPELEPRVTVLPNESQVPKYAFGINVPGQKAGLVYTDEAALKSKYIAMLENDYAKLVSSYDELHHSYEAFKIKHPANTLATLEFCDPFSFKLELIIRPATITFLSRQTVSCGIETMFFDVKDKENVDYYRDWNAKAFGVKNELKLSLPETTAVEKLNAVIDGLTKVEKDSPSKTMHRVRLAVIFAKSMIEQKPDLAVLDKLLLALLVFQHIANAMVPRYKFGICVDDVGTGDMRIDSLFCSRDAEGKKFYAYQLCHFVFGAIAMDAVGFYVPPILVRPAIFWQHGNEYNDKPMLYLRSLVDSADAGFIDCALNGIRHYLGTVYMSNLD